ncbi:MAG: MFS transporter [Myxococcota bacterium]
MSTPAPRTPDLGIGRLLCYALPSLLSSVAALPMLLFVPAFYADDLGVPLASVGIAIAVSRLLDVVTDPWIGGWSDRLRSRFGRRKPFLVAGVPLFALAIWQIFVPPAGAGMAHLLLWSGLLYLAFTMMDLPHKAWGAELSPDYDERSRITSVREGVSTAGQVALLAALVWAAGRGVSEASTQLYAMALGVVIGLPLLVGVAVLAVPEPPAPGPPRPRRSIREGVALATGNPAFLRMVGAVVFFVSGIAIQGTLHRLVLADVMGDEARFPMMVLVENIATLAAVPLWLGLSMRIGKHRALLVAALWLAVFSLPLCFLGPGDTTTLMVWIAIRGSSFASVLFLSNSIAADVIDVDALRAGEARSGFFFAVWGMATKLSLALGAVLGTSLPAAFGYDPSGGSITGEVQASLMWIYGGVPAVMMAVGALFLVGFPITRERHAEVRARLEATPPPEDAG